MSWPLILIYACRTRKIAILIGDGFDMAGYEGLKASLLAGSAVVMTVGTRKSRVVSSSGNAVSPDLHFEGDRSTGYDAVVIPGGKHVEALSKNGRVIHWIREAFGHCKAIGAFGEGTSTFLSSRPYITHHIRVLRVV